jgi:hypothetical protein
MADERRRHGGVDEIPLPPPTPGRLWLCGKHFIGPDVEAALDRTGASTAVCLNERHELDRYPDYVDWLDAHHDRSVWFPVPDLHAPPLDALGPLLTRLHDKLGRGEGLLVHCGAGIGRAGTIAAALLISLGVPLDEALATVSANRPMAGPEAGTQFDLLHALAAR